MYRTLKTLPCLSQIDSLHKRGQKKEKNRMTERHTDRPTDTDRQTDPMLDTDKQTDRPANGYTERQTAYGTIKVKCGSTTKSS